MKDKISMYNAEGTQVGETFTRRARQLVSQQRAEWINNSSIRFMADEEIDISSPDTEDSEHESLLYYLAKRRLKVRQQFIWHSILMIPGYIVCVLLAMIAGSNFVFAVTTASWTTPYLLHILLFIRSLEYRPKHYERDLEREIENLRRIHK